MKKILLFLSIFSFLLAGQAKSQSWKISEASYRIKIQKVSGNNSCKTGYVEIFPCTLESKDVHCRIYRKNSLEVGSVVLCSKRGEPARILFDCSSRESEYDLYLTDKKMPKKGDWQPESGLFLWTKKKKDGPVDNLTQMKKLWQESEEILGASMVPMVFHGVHLHGPSLDFLSYYLGHFQVDREGIYSFATVSDDASFLLVDGKEIASWPGWHGPHQGLHGQYNGQIALKPGIHKLEYYHVQGFGGTTTVAAWKLPGEERWKLIPPQAFLPVASFSCVSCEAPPGIKQKAFFTWHIVRHSMPQDNLSLVEILFKVPEALPNYRYRWSIDDGTQKEGNSLAHLFLRPALRIVQLEVWEKEKKIGEFWQKIHVQPKWDQINAWDEHIFLEFSQEILQRNLLQIPIEDLLYLMRFACAVEDTKWLTSIGSIAVVRHKEWKPEHSSALYDFALTFASLEDNPMIPKKLFQTIISVASDKKILEKTKVRLAYLIFSVEARYQEAKEMIQDISSVPHEEKNKLQILQAEIFAMENQIEKAREILTRLSANPTSSFSILRKARLEQARLLLVQKKASQAKEILKEWESQNPLERINQDTLFVMLQVALANQEYPFALLLCNKLSHLVTLDSDKAWILYYWAQAYKSLGRTQESQNLLQKLLTEFRYSEAAAMARKE